ncbi:hypothetical protein [Streptomyces seoulensis]|uniref:hypothetical protein n=1 Tax=Streptomyces seoulensis TaxID=73044 RepID=UPI001FCC8BE4|nr:hypothetical protein [Streptomyces seoulensis]BDH04874.1 hypothetical protein HEK131_21010 [Streptomyces seoulensis]
MSSNDMPMTAVEALAEFAGRYTDPAAVQALIAEATHELTGRTVVYPADPATARRFVLRRHRDISGVSGVGDVADGVLWPDGTAVVRWRGEDPSTVHWDRGRTSVDRIHGHGGATEIVWLDQDDEQPTVPGPRPAVEAPLVVRRILDRALHTPVPCPKCQRTSLCRCLGADRTEGRIDAVLKALAPWLNTGTDTAA